MIYPLVEKQPPEVFCKKGVLRNVAKLVKNTCKTVSFFNRVAGLCVGFSMFFKLFTLD